ncbi:MAG: hypothetical protein ACI4GV_09295, partial [Acutalibacteraceae bacterium]
MIKKVVKKTVGIILSVVLVLSAFVISFQAYAASDTTVNITIVDVTRKYSSVKTILDNLNQIRTENNLSEFKMDKNLMESAMKRAAELSISSSYFELDGSDSFGGNAAAIITGVGIFSLNSFLSTGDIDQESLDIVCSDFNSVGVGAVVINGQKHVCVLFSYAAADEVDSSAYSQGNVQVNQDTVCLKSKLSNVGLVYPDGQEIFCGSSCIVYLKVVNPSDNRAYAYISPDCLRISSSNTNVLSVSNGYINALKPGTSSVTACLKEDSSVSATSLLKVIAMKFSNCKISDIEDMKYTGKPIEPEVTITDSSGKQLIKGESYTLSYSNNVNVGTAAVKISGLGQYSGEECTKYFNIVSNEDIEYRVSMDVSLSEVGADEIIKLTAKNNLDDTTTKYSFDYSAYGSSNWTSVKSASSDNKCSFSISVPGKYIVRVTASNGSGMTASSQSVITVNSALALNVTLNSKEIVLGNYIKITAQASGSVSPYTYSYMISNNEYGEWVDIKTNTTDTSATYKPDKTGSYSLKVICQSKTGYMRQMLFAIDVVNSSLANKSSISSSNITQGDTIKLYGSATGGTSPYTYAFTVKHSTASSWTTLKAYNTTSSKSWTPAKTGTYEVCAKVKDAKGTEVKKFFTLTVKAAPLANNSTISATTITKGKSVTLKAVAVGGTAPYQYSFTAKHSTATSWTTLKGYNTTSTKTWTPGLTG